MVVFADWVMAYNTRYPHSALAGRTPLEVWRSDPTPVRALEHQEARWMLLARTTHVVQKDGVHHNSEIYFADELWGMAGEEVEVAHMPHDRRWIEIFHDGRWLTTAYPSIELDENARVRALQQRREDEKALRAWATARAAARELAGRADHRAGRDRRARPPARPRAEAGSGYGRATLRLLGLEDQVNRPLEENDVGLGRRERAASVSAEHHLDLVGARVVQTPSLLLSHRAIRDVLAARALGVMHGPAGSGKTFAARLVLDELRVARAWVQFPSRPTMLHVARRLVSGADRR